MNGKETEVKFFVNDLARIEIRLREMKAHLIQPRVHEINHRYDTPDGALRRNGKVLRLRNDTEARFTFKGPSEARQDGVRSRKEIEFSVGSFESGREFLELLGFIPIIFYEKYRTTYEFNRIHVMLDELPYGNFVEIEGEDISALQSVANLLGLQWEAMVEAGYHVLFERIAGKYNLDPGQLSFEVLKSMRVSGADMDIAYADNP